MKANLLNVTFSLLLLNSCSSTNAGSDKLSQLKGESGLKTESVEVSQYPETPEEGALYAKEESHPHEIRVTRGAVHYAHYFDPDGRLRKTERSVDGKIEFITHN